MKNLLDKLFELVDNSTLINDFPVAAIVFDQNYEILGTGYNKRNKTNITIHHAEIIAITEANEKVDNWNLTNKCMLCTLEPCDMCKEVIKQSRISKVYYLVPRYNFKKPYKRTIFKKLDLESDQLYNYTQNITKFFKDKR